MNQDQPARKLRVAIATLGRFHVLDLARELALLGHEVRFYSYVPRQRAVRFGLPEQCHVSLLVFLWPLVALAKVMRGERSRAWLDQLTFRAANWAVQWRMQPCDVFIGMAGIYLEAAIAAKRRYGARIVVERGSMHIDAQKDILDAIRQLHPGAATVPEQNVVRDRKAYEIADVIVVPSIHTERSFLDRGFPPDRLFRNPYGVDLDAFQLKPEIQREEGLVLFVGNWSLRKGVDVLIPAMKTLCCEPVRLCHLGKRGDGAYPDEKWFMAHGHVDQKELAAWYQRAQVLVLPSREEGLSLVLIQALACGCPVVGSERSGARDLQAIPGLSDWVDVVECDDAAVLAGAIRRRLNSAYPVTSTDAIRSQLSWKEYARRYGRMLIDRFAKQ